MPNLSAIQNLFKDTLMNTELPPMHGLLEGCTYYVVGVLHGFGHKITDHVQLAPVTKVKRQSNIGVTIRL